MKTKLKIMMVLMLATFINPVFSQVGGAYGAGNNTGPHIKSDFKKTTFIDLTDFLTELETVENQLEKDESEKKVDVQEVLSELNVLRLQVLADKKKESEIMPSDICLTDHR